MSDKRIREKSVRLIGIILVLVLCRAGWLSSPVMAAENFPTKPITIIVPYSAGGTTDLDARLWAQHLPKHLGQPVVVENHPGGAAVRGTLEVKKAKSDGYTLGMFGYAFMIAPYTLPDAHNPADFIPLARVMTVPYVLGASEKSGFKNLKDLVDFGKKNPKKVLAGMNKGTGDHVHMVMAMKAMGIEPNYVPSGSGSQRATDLAGGHLQLSVDSMSSFRSFIDAKKIIALGVTSADRIDMYNEIPTFREQGYDLVSYYWEGLFAPNGTPPEIIQALETAIEKTSREPMVIDQFKKNHQGLAFMKSDDFAKFITNENQRLKGLIEEMGLLYKK